jgi:hypothetical protein
MKLAADLDRLLTLRRKSERIALEDAMRQEAKLRTAEHSAAEAKRAAHRQLAASRKAERELTASLIGRAVSSNAIARFQMELDAMQAQMDHLDSVAASARGVVAESKQARDAASERFRLRNRDVAKLELLAKHMQDRQIRRGLGLEEAIDEDLAAAAHTRSLAERG